MIVSGQSGLHELGVDACDFGELEHVIGRGFANWGGDLNDSQALLFPGDQKHYAVKLVFDSKHRLIDALAALHSMTRSLLNTLSSTRFWIEMRLV